jgi:hypothetical protein
MTLHDRHDTIYLAAKLAPDPAAFVAAHGCRHVWQDLTLRCPGSAPEKDADAIAWRLTPGG